MLVSSRTVRVAVVLASLALHVAAAAQTDLASAGAPASLSDTAAVSAGALPLRTVREVAALGPALRRDLATGTLAFRSRTEREPVFVVDGVRRLGGPLGGSTLALLGAPESPFAAVTRVGVLAGFVPASVGEAGGGVVVVDTDQGSGRFGAPGFGARVEGLSSAATDAFGVGVASATVRAPLGRRGGVSVTGEVRQAGDAVPSAGTSLRLTDAAAERLRESPQAIAVADAGGATRFVPFPTDAALAAIAAGRPFGAADVAAALGLPAGSRVASLNPVDASALLTEADVERTRRQDDPLRDVAISGQAEAEPLAGLRLRVGGGAVRRTATATAPTPGDALARRLLDPDGLSAQTVTGATAFGALDGRLSPAVSVALRVSAERTASVLRPSAFSDNVADALAYTDIDGDAAALARRYVRYVGSGYVRPYADDAGSFPGARSASGFALGGAPATAYDRQSAASLQVAGSVSARVGAHRLEAGAEAERQTFRRFALDGYSLAAYAADADGGQGDIGFPGGVARYDQLSFEVFRGISTAYGYSFDGLETTDTEDVVAYLPDASGRRADTSVAPFRPLTAAAFVRDAFSVGPAQIDLGLRADLYDARATTLLDPFAPFPILRAGDLASAPAGIGDDFAVYRNSNAQTVGFRDLGGQFYSATGAPVGADAVLVVARGVATQTDAPRAEAFARTRRTVRFQPRVGVRVQAGPRAVVTAYAVRLSRRPDPSLFVPFTAYEEVSGASAVTGNAGLQPETTDAAGVGVELAAAPGVTVGAQAWARQTRGVPVRRTFEGGFPTYTGVAGDGRRDEAGLDLTLAVARTRGVALHAAYALATVSGASSDRDVFDVARYELATPSDARGLRHALDLAADVQVPSGRGPRVAGVAVLGGLGVGVVVAVQSGAAYTALRPNVGFSVFDSFTTEVRGGINEARLPWTSQVDLRVERRFAVGGGTLRAFAWAENLLGTRNTLAVYRSTGDPAEDGFAATPAGQQALDTPGERLLYAAYTGGPAGVGSFQATGAPFVYGQPRQVRLGVVVEL